MKKKQPENLMDGLLYEMNRVRELIKEYDRLPDGVGFFGSSIMRCSINEAEKSISSGDVLKMINAYEDLKDCE